MATLKALAATIICELFDDYGHGRECWLRLYINYKGKSSARLYSQRGCKRVSCKYIVMGYT